MDMQLYGIGLLESPMKTFIPYQNMPKTLKHNFFPHMVAIAQNMLCGVYSSHYSSLF